MSIVVVERSFAEPAEYTALQARELEPCLQRHRVRARYTLFSRDRRHMVCVYDAPDAEAVRRTQDENEMPYDRVWSAQALRLPPATRDPRYEWVVVQRLLPHAVTLPEIEAAAADPLGCNRRHRCSLLDSVLSLDGTRMICQYSAPDAESVRNASTQGQVPFVRVWVATIFGGCSDK